MDCNCCRRPWSRPVLGDSGAPEGLKPVKIRGSRVAPGHSPLAPLRDLYSIRWLSRCNGGGRRRTITQMVKFQPELLKPIALWRGNALAGAKGAKRLFRFSLAL